MHFPCVGGSRQPVFGMEKWDGSCLKAGANFAPSTAVNEADIASNPLLRKLKVIKFEKLNADSLRQHRTDHLQARNPIPHHG